MSVPLFVFSSWRENALVHSHMRKGERNLQSCFSGTDVSFLLPPFLSFLLFLFPPFCSFSPSFFSPSVGVAPNLSLLYQVALLPYRGPAENEKPGQHLYVKSGPGGRGRADTHDTFEFFIPIQAMGALLLRSVLFHSDTHMNLTDSDVKDLLKIRTGK